MKLFSLVLAQAGFAHAKTDVHFNHDHESPEIAQLEKWNDLAKKFFRMHEADLRPQFYRRWAGQNGRFQREIRKLEQNFLRKCSNKNSIPRRYERPQAKADQVSRRSIESNHELIAELSPKNRDRRSEGQLRVAHNPGHRMRHIVRNVEKWTEQYLTGCSNQVTVISRWQRFVDRWESEMLKNPIFQQEFEKEAKYLKQTRGQPGQPCGRLYREFGLHGSYMELQSGENYGFGNLGYTDFGNDELMSMIPYEGCYIRAYQHYNKEGYSSICSDTAGCSVTPNEGALNGALTENTASSAYCYCDEPRPKDCALIFMHDSEGKARFREGWAIIFDGFKLGYDYGLEEFDPVYVPNDALSSIYVSPGCAVDIWEDTNARGDHFQCSGSFTGKWCYSNGLGRVGNDETSTIKCTCN